MVDEQNKELIYVANSVQVYLSDLHVGRTNSGWLVTILLV